MPADRTRRQTESSRPADPDRDSAETGPGARDLIAVNPQQSPRKGKLSRYADTLFLAHIFASKFGAPQQRERRKADPADANASYRKSAKRPAKPGRVLSKKV